MGTTESARTKDDEEITPTHLACCHGLLGVAKWLFEVGAAEDVRAEGSDESTPVPLACCHGHLDFAKWLFEVGAISNSNSN